jgi:hypothetical protein
VNSSQKENDHVSSEKLFPSGTQGPGSQIQPHAGRFPALHPATISADKEAEEHSGRARKAKVG